MAVARTRTPQCTHLGSPSSTPEAAGSQRTVQNRRHTPGMKQEEGESLSLWPIAHRLPQVLSTLFFLSTIYILFFSRVLSLSLRELAPCLDFGAGRAPASLNRGGGSSVLRVHGPIPATLP